MVLDYKKFKGEYCFYPEDQVFAGQAIDISDLISFEADSEQDIENAFKEAVDDYIEFCNEIGKKINLK